MKKLPLTAIRDLLYDCLEPKEAAEFIIDFLEIYGEAKTAIKVFTYIAEKYTEMLDGIIVIRSTGVDLGTDFEQEVVNICETMLESFEQMRKKVREVKNADV